MLEDFIADLYGETFSNVFSIIIGMYPIWLPLATGVIFWHLWVRYIRLSLFASTETTLLEIRIPRDIMKSPVAMELALLAMQQFGGETTFISRFWEGKVRAWFSLEIASIGGEIRFYVWTRKNMRNIVESNFYAQYPNIEIAEVEDYTKHVSYKPGVNDMWGCHYEFTKPDAYPIKTYIDYGLDKDPKEEFKNDPLVSILEFMGSIKPDEQIWLQIIIRSHKKEKRGGIFSPTENWSKAAQDEINKIHEKIKKESRTRPSPGESDTIAAIERSLGKYPYDTGLRCMYVTDTKEAFNNATVTGIRGLMKPVSSNNLNSLLSEKATDFNYPWQDFKGIRVNKMKREMLDSYKRRMYFFYPYKFKPYILTNEELATLYHFPGQTALTPGLPRIPSKRSQAPTNLPT